MPLDERATLTNMAVEAGSFTGVIAADDRVVEHLARTRGLDPESIRSRIVRSDPDARYREHGIPRGLRRDLQFERPGEKTCEG